MRYWHVVSIGLVLPLDVACVGCVAQAANFLWAVGDWKPALALSHLANLDAEMSTDTLLMSLARTEFALLGWVGPCLPKAARPTLTSKPVLDQRVARAWPRLVLDQPSGHLLGYCTIRVEGLREGPPLHADYQPRSVPFATHLHASGPKL